MQGQYVVASQQVAFVMLPSWRTMGNIVRFVVANALHCILLQSFSSPHPNGLSSMRLFIQPRHMHVMSLVSIQSGSQRLHHNIITGQPRGCALLKGVEQMFEKTLHIYCTSF